MKSVESTVRVRDNVVVREWRNGAVVRTFRVHNTWGTAGLNAIRDWFAGLSRVPVTHIAWLDAGGVERARDIVTQRVIPGDGSLLIRQYLPSATSANGHTQTLQRQIGCMHEIDSNRKRQRSGPGVAQRCCGPDVPGA